MREGTERGFRNFKLRPLKGYLTTKDMVKLETLKNRFFLDSDAVESYLGDTEAPQDDSSSPKQKITSMMRSDGKDGCVDHKLVPLSSSLISDCQNEIRYTNTRFCKPGERGYFEQNFSNKYFAEQNKKHLQKQALALEVAQEREKPL